MFDISQDVGGLHADYTRVSRSFNADTGEQLTLADMAQNEEQLKTFLKNYVVGLAAGDKYKAKAREPSVSAAFINSGDRNILISKLASSAAHVKHAGAATDPAVSSESCTWICEHFCETAGAVKTFLDRLFLSGVNHVFYHGMCYSAADAKWPGWTFYASLEMNRFNPLWHDADVLNAYVARVQSIARTTAIDNDLLVYWPLHDLWMDPKGLEQQLTVHRRSWMTEQPVGRIAPSVASWRSETKSNA